MLIKFHIRSVNTLISLPFWIILEDFYLPRKKQILYVRIIKFLA